MSSHVCSDLSAMSSQNKISPTQKASTSQKLASVEDNAELPISVDAFQHILLQWQKNHGRHDLPWQQSPTPYRVLVSEIMLQQTQVVTVIPYFNRWMESFPTIKDLAKASEDQVMQHWQGLGYYSRARNLRKAAMYIEQECQGQFPNTLEGLIKIPGVGRYTAGAIASFAYDQYGPIVDGNVKRLFCRLFGIEGVPGTSAVDKKLWQLAHLYTPDSKPIESTQDKNKIHEKPASYISNRSFAQGLLDMGATLCKAKNPDCSACHFNHVCIANTEQKVDKLPTPKPKKVTPIKAGHFIWLWRDGKLLLEKRAEGGIWGSLWCLPQIYLEESQIESISSKIGTFKHTFSHYKLDANVWALDDITQDDANQRWFKPQDLPQLGLPTPIKKFIVKQLKD